MISKEPINTWVGPPERGHPPSPRPVGPERGCRELRTSPQAERRGYDSITPRTITPFRFVHCAMSLPIQLFAMIYFNIVSRTACRLAPLWI